MHIYNVDLLNMIIIPYFVSLFRSLSLIYKFPSLIVLKKSEMVNLAMPINLKFSKMK